MAIAIKVDEDLPREFAVRLTAAGHDALSVGQQGWSGKRDDELWPLIQQEARCLFTADKGFADARAYPVGTHSGVVLFRLARESRGGYLRLLDFALQQLPFDHLQGSVVVVAPDAIRFYRA